MTPTYLLLALGAFLLLELARSHSVLRRALRRRPDPPRLSRYPSVTVIRPIKGLDHGLAENLRAALAFDYPGPVETLFVFDDPHEPAVPLVREAIAMRRLAGRATDARVVFSGEPPAGRTGKLNAMIAGFGLARGEVIAFADSDTRAAPDTLRVVVETLLGTAGAGAAFAPVVATEAPATLGDAGYAVMLNGLYGPVAADTARRNGETLPFVMGEFSVFTREALTAIGGLECADGQLVDDMYLGSRIHAAGYRNVVAPRRVPIVERGAGLREFWLLYVRWIAFSRSGLPAREFKRRSYVLPVIFWAGLAASAVALASGWWTAALVDAAVPLGIAFALDALHRAMGGATLGLRGPVASFLVLLTAPLVLASIALRREVHWRGRVYRLDAHALLDARAPAEPALEVRSTPSTTLLPSAPRPIRIAVVQGRWQASRHRRTRW